MIFATGPATYLSGARFTCRFERARASFLGRCRLEAGEEEQMAAGTAAETTTGEEAAMQAVAAAMRDAAATASDHAAKVKESASEAGATALESISKMVYTGSYVLAYGLVYAAVFVARSLPQENPIMRGFRDGGRAAMGELDAG
jgi:hypothetical protein